MAYAFQNESKLHIVMEFVKGGELFTHLCKKKKFDLNSAKIIIAEIVVALENIHKVNGVDAVTDQYKISERCDLP